MRISSTTTHRLEELAVRLIDPVLLVGVDLPGLGFPPHSSGRSSSKEAGTGSAKYAALSLSLSLSMSMSMSESGRAVPAAWLP